MTDPLQPNQASASPVPRLALRPKEAATALGIGVRKLWELTNTGEIPHVKVGACTLYHVNTLNQWLAEQSRSVTKREGRM